MCTAATYQTKDFYFGRTLDYEFSYGEEVVATPRSFPLAFRHLGTLEHHHAIIGMAHRAEGYPLYYDAVNEAGVAMAGLNFVGNAAYREPAEGKDNVAQFEFIPWVLGQCGSLDQVRRLLGRMNLVGTPFSRKLPTASLHWIIAAGGEAVTVESTAEGLFVYDNPAGVLTNNPPFPVQMFLLNNYRSVSPEEPENRFAPELPLRAYSRGMGGLGLPGDLSSASRFVRAAFTRANAVSGDSEEESVGQFFHILGAVEQTRGCCRLASGEYEITQYTSCCNVSRGIYYYTTYGNRQITAVDLHREDSESRELIAYPLVREEQIFRQN